MYKGDKYCGVAFLRRYSTIYWNIQHNIRQNYIFYKNKWGDIFENNTDRYTPQSTDIQTTKQNSIMTNEGQQ